MNKRNVITLIVSLFLLAMAGGFWKWENNQKVEIDQQQKQVENQEQVQQQEEKVVVDISDWKIYRDEKYGFEIKHPRDWEFKDSGTNAFGGEWISIVINDNLSIVMQINRRELKTGYLEWIRNQINPLVGKEVEMEIIGDNLMNNDIHAWHVISSDNTQTFKYHEYFISNKKTIVVIHFTEIYEKGIYSSYLSDFKTMVHSIKFFD
ncbi:MAG: hypothetical protein ACD_11C00055G0002 [uncultured bacterium]|nr:MAG: hypothetical protein ACD_11C00055G0002 [uncultured bacterium]HBR71259.1 hypothetical protein [Candidatus Moranbacteria bacterium]